MSKLVILAGPQAAGKSTVITHLSRQPYTVAPLFPGGKAPLIFPLQESRQIIAHMHMLLGAIFMTVEEEIEVVQCDLRRMDLILHRNHRLIYLDECNIFTIAHAVAHGVTEVERYWDEYIARLKRLEAAVIFLDVPPNVSWDRRLNRYQQRLVYFPENHHQVILERYHEYLMRLHPLLINIYDHLPFPKAMVDGQCSEENVIKAVCHHLVHL
jgi:hypothetical protein